MSTFQKELAALLSTVKLLQCANEKKDHTIKAPESRIDDLEQYSRIDDVIITGLVTTHQTYARATATKNTDNVNTDAEALQDEPATLEDKVVKFFHSKGIDIEPNYISAYRTLGTGTRNASSTQHRTPAPPRIISLRTATHHLNPHRHASSYHPPTRINLPRTATHHLTPHRNASSYPARPRIILPRTATHHLTFNQPQKKCKHAANGEKTTRDEHLTKK